MARLPIPGSDDGSWGDILNSYLLQSLTADGSIKTGVVGSPQLADTAVTSAKLAPSAVTASHLSTGSVTNSAIADGAIAQGKIANLSGDLAGKAGSVHTHTASQLSDATTAGRTLITAADATAQRTALGLGSAATLTVGTTAGTVAAGDDSRLTGALQTNGLDAATAGLVGNSASATMSSLSSTLVTLKGANLARFIERARAGENLSITCVGDSILEGQTVTNPATDGAMILLAADLSTRFGITVTQTNHASSGYTAARAHINGNVTAAIAEAADLYIVSAFDKNDLGSDVYGQYAAGYPIAQSTAAVERIIRAIRSDVPKADIIILATNPYVAGSSSNAYQAAKIAAERRNAAAYGCEFVDCYTAFTARGDYSGLMGDSTHPNTAGHRLIADTILEHLTDIPRAPSQPGALPAGGLHNPAGVNVAATNYGYAVNATPGAAASVTYVTGGSGWSSEVTSTANDYVEAVATATEILVQISTADEDACVVDVAVDGVTVQSNLNLTTTGGKKGTYWVPFAVGLSGGGASHTLRLTLKSGTLRAFATAALLSKAASFTPESRTVTLFGTPATVTMTTSYQDIGADTTITLPSGWGSMDVLFTGYVVVRCSGATTARRRIDVAVRTDGNSVNGTRQQNLAVQDATHIFGSIPLTGIKRGVTASTVVDVIAKVDDATNTIQTTAVYLDAVLIRAS